MALNESQIALRTGGNYTLLKDYLDKRNVILLPFTAAQVLTISTAQYALIASTVLSGTLAVGTSTTTSGGISVATLVGAVGTAATTIISDSLGNILNKVDIRDSTTHDEVIYTDGANARTVFGLLQCSSGISDGAAIGGGGSENLQISFVYFSSACVLTLCTVNQTIEFQVNKVITSRNTPTIQLVGGGALPDILERKVEPIRRGFVVTTAFAANEVITLSNGNGASLGRSTPDGDTMTLATSNALFTNTNSTKVRDNGDVRRKGSGNDAVWDSTTTFHFTYALDIGDYFEIEMLNA